MRVDNTVIQLHNSNEMQSKVVSEKAALGTNSQSQASEDIFQKLKQDPTYQPTISEKSIINAIEKANQKILGSNTELHISIHEKTKELLVKVMNSDTKEVIREIPSEKILDMVGEMWEHAGIIVDERR